MQNYKSITELTALIRETLELNFDAISVEGEISNFKSHISGHWYFTLKDSNAQISCAMWKGFNNYVFFTPEDGMKVIVNGKITVYPPRGTYQIDVRSMKPAGVGELQAAFEKLKQKLSDEGLFDDDQKKEIPRFPQKIGVITGSESAALRDMINIATRRYPLVELVVAPAKVQGDGAAKQVAELIEQFNQLKDMDLLIVARGGGSLEDLWAFNEEIVARAIYNSKIPVISGVGHEIDFTIADFVADLRAPTPSAAMELSTPSAEEILLFLEDYSAQLEELLFEKVDEQKETIDQLLNSFGFRSVEALVQNKMQTIDNLYSQISKNIVSSIKEKNHKVKYLNQVLEGYNIEKTLKKGFTLINQNGKFVSRANALNVNTKFGIKFFDDEVEINNG